MVLFLGYLASLNLIFINLRGSLQRTILPPLGTFLVITTVGGVLLASSW